MAPLILGFVLGDMMEQNLRRALSISNGDVSILVGSPITIGLWVAAVLMLVVPLTVRVLTGRRSAGRRFIVAGKSGCVLARPSRLPMAMGGYISLTSVGK